MKAKVFYQHSVNCSEIWSYIIYKLHCILIYIFFVALCWGDCLPLFCNTATTQWKTYIRFFFFKFCLDFRKDTIISCLHSIKYEWLKVWSVEYTSSLLLPLWISLKTLSTLFFLFQNHEPSMAYVYKTLFMQC